ncbi:hypothetical protein LOZ61_004342 [Ophidiomyces ophidiicola]|uniref:Uncharacterized protein n=1 Tax=Ophidiomyces ophidiicola TaxID=1387563 RepID=A0ACB8V309_9EURO|nr:hypothetical protein LOZ61_004342 [Ophidiomyces ophidiicola]KAI1916323.1 hypothetical protein LOZ64_003362 [Ophidiomyces ophidiicola]KAI1930682.1 hypothetical protein LOZ60_000658 [Ophidiomyces ophidiicola]KAI1955427.1 hypothetical protein LOZ59_004565 [Ophidiomyces ophidiicola]KAI1976199.1 hypothetical protein LOZ56_000238 [Ophidiomyces ophidiicola]
MIGLSLFVLSALLLLLSADTSSALGHPAESAAFSLFCSGIVLLVAGFLVPSFLGRRKDPGQWEYIPLSNSRAQSSTSVPLDAFDKLETLKKAKIRKLLLSIALAIFILCLRVELYRQSVRRSYCASFNVSAFIPLILAVYEFLISRRKSSLKSPDSVPKYFTSILSTLVLAIAGLLTTSLKDGWRGTFICPIIGSNSKITLSFQVLGSVFDAVLILLMARLTDYAGPRDGTIIVWKTSTLWGFVLLGSAIIWFAIEILLLSVPIGDRLWVLSPLPSYFDALKQSALFAMFCLSASKAVFDATVLTLTFVFTSLLTYYSLFSCVWTSFSAFPALDIAKTALVSILLHITGYIYLRSSSSPDIDGKRGLRPNGWLRWVILVSLVMSITFIFEQTKSSPFHPIDTFIENAKGTHDRWITKASSSKSLKDAVLEYQRRYHQAPPPGFDVWYEYATNRSSVIIDDYDQIYEDLLPFRSISPKRLRDLVSLMVNDHWNEVSSVVVRNGKAEPQADIRPTHRWMVEGISRMIDPYSKYLPDMDIAFNLNDECRVAVPWETLESITNTGNTKSPLGAEVSNSWSDHRAKSWSYSAGDPKSHRMFVDHSFKKVYDSFGRTLCSPESKARTTIVWNKQVLCTACTEPHSLGQFIRDWKLSADICHQPDLSFLHGFFLSPASFKVSQELLPVFSQSKVSGFNDILYPSSWNYIDKVKYEPSNEHPDPPYSEKQPAAFWRGTTSEGRSNYGTWKGMVRQRLIHLANNHTSNTVSVLLPTAKKDAFSYQTFAGSEIFQSLGLNTSIFIAESVARCAGEDCEDQTREFGTVPRTDFQDHWKYRFLFDMDGAGFSGRFLPFLKSNSLPFRTSLFRQWLDSRLTPWLHFVPQDLRLHDFFSTLAYFAGAKELDNNGNMKRAIMEPHTTAGEWIAGEGQKWANTAIRKEDMEIYMFRLLLEWGRLTDDRRDELGFLV